MNGALRWERRSAEASDGREIHDAYSGTVRVVVVHRHVVLVGGYERDVWEWVIVQVAADGHATGTADTPETARAAAAAAWIEWCAKAGLVPAGEVEQLHGALTRLVRALLRDRERPGVDAVLGQGTRDAHAGAWDVLCERFASAHAADARPPPVWRPIEEVKPEGEDETFLVYCPDMRVSGPCVAAYFQNGEWCAAVSGYPLTCRPTHAMPMPPGPGAGNGA